MHIRAVFAHGGASLRPCRQSGVGLIEVLVAVLVLAIGFLGVGALLSRSLSSNNTSMSHSMATVASYSILDAMRADLDSAKNGDYNTTVTADACDSISDSDLSGAQLKEWCEQLQTNLGNRSSTTGTIACTTTSSSASSATCTITIRYDDRHAVGTDGTEGGTQTVITKGML